jgi:hypothetical protein
MIEYLINAGYGAIGGLIFAASGYLKATPDHEGFDIVKFAPTVVIGAFVGAATAVKLDPELYVIPLSGFITVVIDKIIGFFRKKKANATASKTSKKK